MSTRSILISAGVGGVTMALFSIMPILNYGNCLLCLWLWVGGGLSVFIYTNIEKDRLPTSTDGLVLGLVSGLVGALLVGSLYAVVGLGMMAFMGLSLRDQLANSAGSQELLPFLATEGIFILVASVVYLLAFPIVGALAGLIGVELFGKPRPQGLQ